MSAARDYDSLGFREVNDPGGYLDGWARLGIGIRPVDLQRSDLEARGLERLQFDFSKSYGDAPADLSLLYDYPTVQAVQCSAHYMDSAPLNALCELLSFRDAVYNRERLDWSRFSALRDLYLEDYHGKHHPDYTIFRDLRSLDTAYLPRKFSQLPDLPLTRVEKLCIRSSPIYSFRGLEDLLALRDLSIIGCRAFEGGEISGQAPHLKRLVLAFCPKVTSLEFLRHMPALEVLELERLGAIESFEPLRGHPSLRRIEAPPLKGARITAELANSLPTVEFVSSSLLAD